MIGCRFNAKNRLDLNYLYLVEGLGAKIHPETTVTAVRPRRDGGYFVDTRHTTRRREKQSITAEQVVFAAGTLGTQKLLHRMRDGGLLPNLSARLGELTRTNSEAILGARSRDRNADYSKGVAITSSFHPDDRTHIEPVRYGKGSNSMGLLQSVLTDADKGPRWREALREVRRNPRDLKKLFWLKGWAEQTIIVLVMQSLDNSLTVSRKAGRFRDKLISKQGHGQPNPTWIPAGNDATRRLAERINGVAGGSVGELANIPMTAHIIGGAPIGLTVDDGVVDPWQRLFGHPGLHVTDGAAITANLGVNPSLTITAQAERAMAFWPNQGDADPRPELGSPYVELAAVAPRNPAVPASAHGALRLPSQPATAA
jgi:cholesterol oxidase